ncbi:uncharacterized protein BJ171DRAFT_503197 [Polychytrium aggregatum]|uniref:uncharacterized protein n=1 Tax=Polychytrium aggregatum TaxID=110093 RepID=UPI0022FEA39D|nr:uncharacterized protein BJ171DRAFT_503197 [Polychytrium aggregatum]KAI9205190.1 hypothetical protein BJ171DRAFT_503197 [Polychytrium aggregatum]
MSSSPLWAYPTPPALSATRSLQQQQQQQQQQQLQQQQQQQQQPPSYPIRNPSPPSQHIHGYQQRIDASFHSDHALGQPQNGLSGMSPYSKHQSQQDAFHAAYQRAIYNKQRPQDALHPATMAVKPFASSPRLGSYYKPAEHLESYNGYPSPGPNPPRPIPIHTSPNSPGFSPRSPTVYSQPPKRKGGPNLHIQTSHQVYPQNPTLPSPVLQSYMTPSTDVSYDSRSSNPTTHTFDDDSDGDDPWDMLASQDIETLSASLQSPTLAVPSPYYSSYESLAEPVYPLQGRRAGPGAPFMKGYSDPTSPTATFPTPKRVQSPQIRHNYSPASKSPMPSKYDYASATMGEAARSPSPYAPLFRPPEHVSRDRLPPGGEGGPQTVAWASPPDAQLGPIPMPRYAFVPDTATPDHLPKSDVPWRKPNPPQSRKASRDDLWGYAATQDTQPREAVAAAGYSGDIQYFSDAKGAAGPGYDASTTYASDPIRPSRHARSTGSMGSMGSMGSTGSNHSTGSADSKGSANSTGAASLGDSADADELDEEKDTVPSISISALAEAVKNDLALNEPIRPRRNSLSQSGLLAPASGRPRRNSQSIPTAPIQPGPPRFIPPLISRPTHPRPCIPLIRGESSGPGGRGAGQPNRSSPKEEGQVPTAPMQRSMRIVHKIFGPFTASSSVQFPVSREVLQKEQPPSRTIRIRCWDESDEAQAHTWPVLLREIIVNSERVSLGTRAQKPTESAGQLAEWVGRDVPCSLKMVEGINEVSFFWAGTGKVSSDGWWFSIDMVEDDE